MKGERKRKPWAAGLLLVAACFLLQGLLRAAGCKKSGEDKR